MLVRHHHHSQLFRRAVTETGKDCNNLEVLECSSYLGTQGAGWSQILGEKCQYYFSMMAEHLYHLVDEGQDVTVTTTDFCELVVHQKDGEVVVGVVGTVPKVPVGPLTVDGCAANLLCGRWQGVLNLLIETLHYSEEEDELLAVLQGLREEIVPVEKNVAGQPGFASPRATQKK